MKSTIVKVFWHTTLNSIVKFHVYFMVIQMYKNSITTIAVSNSQNVKTNVLIIMSIRIKVTVQKMADA